MSDYNSRTSMRAYYADRTTRQLARHISAEATLHDLAEIGLVDFFEGSGSDPSGLPGYASDKLWLRQYANVQDQAGDFLVWNGDEPASDVENWVSATPNWFHVLSSIRDANMVFTVGAGGDYTTLSAALTAASRWKDAQFVQDGLTVEVRLLAGYELNEQIVVNSLDLSWISITSVDAEVRIDHTAITETTFPNEQHEPAFTGLYGAKLPRIACLFAYDDNSTAKDGITVAFHSEVDIAPECGIKFCRRGLSGLYGSRITCNMPGLTQGGGGSGAGSTRGADFQGCSSRALQLQHGSFASLPRANFDDCEGDNAVYVIWSSTANVYQATANNHSGTNAAFHARDGSIMCARETSCNDAANRGYHALHGAILDARSGSATGCGDVGILANAACLIDATEADVSGSYVGVRASAGCKIHFWAGLAANCGAIGVEATEGCEINALDADVSGSAIGVSANKSSTVNAESIVGSGCGTGIAAARGSTVNAQSADVSNAVSIGINCGDMSTVNAKDADASGAGTTGFNVYRAGQINASSGSGTLSKTANTLGSDGIIYDSSVAAPASLKRVVSSGAAAALTGSTSETALATITIAAGEMGANGFLRITTNWAHTNNANAKTLRVRWNGAVGTAVMGVAAANQARTHSLTHIYNRNSASAQISGTNAGNAAGYGQSTSAQVTDTIDTANAVDVVISGELASAGDTITLQSYVVEVFYAP